MSDQGDPIYYDRLVGIKSLFENKILGIYLVKIFPIFIGLKIYFREKLRFYDYIIIFMIFLMLLFSYHRTSIFIFLLFIFLAFIIIKEFRNYFINISILSIVTFLVSILIFPDLSKSIISKTKNQILTETGINLYPEHYLGHYKTSIKMVKRNFIFGTGPNTFKYLCSDKEYETIYDKFINYKGQLEKLNSCSTHTHNFYLQIFSESGVFTFLLFSFFYIFIFKELVLCLIGKNNIQNNQFYKICLISTLCNFFPIAPSVDFFNTYLNSILYMPCIFILYFKLKSKNFFVSY
jgi:O-antigen ligase